MEQIRTAIPAQDIARFLRNFRVDEAERSVSLPLIIDYIERSMDANELRNWTVSVRGRESLAPDLGGPAGALVRAPADQPE